MRTLRPFRNRRTAALYLHGATERIRREVRFGPIASISNVDACLASRFDFSRFSRCLEADLPKVHVSQFHEWVIRSAYEGYP